MKNVKQATKNEKWTRRVEAVPPVLRFSLRVQHLSLLIETTASGRGRDQALPFRRA